MPCGHRLFSATARSPVCCLDSLSCWLQDACPPRSGVPSHSHLPEGQACSFEDLSGEPQREASGLSDPVPGEPHVGREPPSTVALYREDMPRTTDRPTWCNLPPGVRADAFLSHTKDREQAFPPEFFMTDSQMARASMSPGGTPSARFSFSTSGPPAHPQPHSSPQQRLTEHRLCVSPMLGASVGGGEGRLLCAPRVSSQRREAKPCAAG